MASSQPGPTKSGQAVSILKYENGTLTISAIGLDLGEGRIVRRVLVEAHEPAPASPILLPKGIEYL